MPRDYKVYLEDILEAAGRVLKFTSGLAFSDFVRDLKTHDAVIRNLEIIGEAIKKVPEEVRKEHPKVEWKKIGSLRDILIHEYFGVDDEILWDIVQHKLPKLKNQVESLLKE